MDELFGVPTNSIMAALVILLAICLLTVAWVAIRRRVVFTLGVRNIPRRKAQTVLIVIGLMLSTLIIAAAFGTGDTIDHSVTASTYEGLGATDELVVASKDEEGEGSIVNALDLLMPESVAAEVRQHFADSQLVDGVLPVLIQRVPAIKLNDVATMELGLSEPSTYLVGIDPAGAQEFGGLKDLDGSTIDVASIRSCDIVNDPPGTCEIVLSEDLADELEAQAGDVIAVFYDNRPNVFTVKAVAEDSPLSGRFDQTTPGMAVSLDQLQAMTGLEGQITAVAVSNRGGIEDGIELTDDVSGQLIELFAGDPYGIDKIKQASIEFAELFSSLFTTIFLIFGLFSIAVGILLIVLIFTMLAAERRAEMGMTRAVGAQRRQLMQQFVAEGTIYALAAGFVGALLGAAAAYAIGYGIRPLFGEFLTIEPKVAPRSLVIAYCLGVVITFIAVVVSSWKISNLNIVAAIRDIPEVSRAGSDRRFWRPGTKLSGSIILALGILCLIAAAALMASGSSAEDATDTEKAMAGVGSLLLLPGGFGLVWGMHRAMRPFWGLLMTLVGIAGTIVGQMNDSAFLFFGGMSLLPFGIGVLLRFYGVPTRPVFTVIGVYIVVLWLLPPSIETRLWGELNGDIEMFFLSGIFMVTGATIVIVQNLKGLLGLVTRIGGVFRSKLPAVRTAVAFPGAAAGRTGMTIAMFSLIIFSMVVFSSINQNFSDLFISDEAAAGWDVRADTSGANPIGDTGAFVSLLQRNDIPTSDIEASGQLTVNFQNKMRRSENQEWRFFPIAGMDDQFTAESEVTFQQRAAGYPDDAAIIDALINEPDAVVVSSHALPVEGPFGGDPSQFTLDDPDGDGPQQALSADDKGFEPIPVQIQAADGSVKTVRVIGVIDQQISTLFGLYASQRLSMQINPRPSVIAYFLRLSDPQQAEERADRIETALARNGVQGSAIKDELKEAQQQNTGFLLVFQGFMGLGLIVGIAAVGVIAFRSVVERRQQIGVLRAIGYQQSLVSQSFLIETLFLVGMGVLSGATLGILLSWKLFSSEDFTGTENATFTVPWLIIIVILIITVVAALLMTLVPARQASRLAPAEALRYE